MKKVMFMFAMLLGAELVDAGTLNVNWTNPTAYTDGTTLAAADITQTRVEYGTCGTSTPLSFGVKAGETVVTGGATSAVINSLAPGVYCVQAKTTAQGIESDASNVATKTLLPPKPNPPAAVTIGSLIAYDIIKQPGKLVLLAVGKVAGGIACDTTQSVNGLYAIPTDAIAWFGTVRPPVAFAACG